VNAIEIVLFLSVNLVCTLLLKTPNNAHSCTIPIIMTRSDVDLPQPGIIIMLETWETEPVFAYDGPKDSITFSC